MTEIEKDEKLSFILDRVVMALGIIMVIIHLIYAKSYVINGTQFRNAHLIFALMIVFLESAGKAKKNWTRYLLIAMFFVIMACGLYINFNYTEIMDRTWANTRLDLVVGATLIILCLVSVKLSIGWFMLLLILGICVYPFFGQYLPAPFTTKAYPLMMTIGNYAITLNTGIYGSNLMTSAEYVFLFIVFGSLLSATGVQKFFWELGKLLFRKLPSGPCMMAVLNSALVGSVTGSVVANVMITGVYTIPTMKKAGIKSEVAGAMEAAASCGGQLVPPVMGTVAFIMASYTGIPYIRICEMALIPAFMYYLGVGLFAHFAAMKSYHKAQTVQKMDFFAEEVDYRTFFWKMPGFLVPVGLIVYLLAKNVAVLETAFWAIIALITVNQMVPKDLRPPLKDLIKGMGNGAKEGSSLAVILCATGLILITFTGSGLAIKIASSIQFLSGGTTFGVLLIVWIMSVLFGMIGVSSVAYYMSAAFAASILMKTGLSLEAVHFFLMFPCIFAGITPPVALGCLAAAKLSGSDYIKCCYETMRAAFTAFLLPFFAIYAPSIILQRSPASPVFWIEIGLCVLFIISANFMFIGYLVSPLPWSERGLMGAVALGSFLYLFLRIPAFLLMIAVAFTLFVIKFAFRFRKVKI
ncbi:transporter [Synergistales bacterium]|nr:transporter [Synergistales bacterium]